MSFRCELHPIYGAVPREGDTVEAGQILGLSADGHATITAPFSGQVHLVRTAGQDVQCLVLEILPTAARDAAIEREVA